ncbi:flagellar brake protein [Ideonella livida]|uniref:Flagellar brake protein n=1 Tax=Ideonella livida TaxID=2707176 RepID=A0A7C9TKA8_9BURK|nr:flagellar brake protein [Ideonella livida]NDY92338.1 flagellar brake protein [Ideonella livida]
MLAEPPAPLPTGAGPAAPASAEYSITEPAAVQELLRSLMDRNVPVTLSGSDGSALQTTLWSVDHPSGRIAFQADLVAPQLQQLVEAEEATAIGYLDQVKVQFDVAELMLVHGGRASVLQAARPPQVFRFQRRTAYRVRLLHHLAPMVSFRHPQLPDMLLELRMLDLSAGGCALLLPLSMPPVPPGVRINGARMMLEDRLQLDVCLVVHHVTAIQPGGENARLGCELLGLQPPAQRALQRYIDQAQKTRRMMALD